VTFRSDAYVFISVSPIGKALPAKAPISKYSGTGHPPGNAGYGLIGGISTERRVGVEKGRMGWIG
jgi:hypothetical protein